MRSCTDGYINVGRSVDRVKMSGKDTAIISDEERGALVKFRAALADVLHNREYEDYQLVTWLRARKLDVRNAESMFRESQQWRKLVDMDAKIDTYQIPEVFAKFVAQALLGHAKDGSTVLLIKAGSMDYYGLLQCTSSDALVFYQMWLVEQCVKGMAAWSAEKGRRATQLILILDLKGYKMSQFLNFPVANMLRKSFSTFDKNYPEHLNTAYAVNVSGNYKMLFDLICRVSLSEETCRKFQFLEDISQFKDVLLNVIDADVLPVEYGGTRTDPDGDPTCKTLVVPGGPVPKSYYRSHRVKSGDFEKNVTVNRRSKFRVEIQSAGPQSTLQWEFLSVGGDIGFGVHYVTEDRKLELQAVRRVPSNEEPIKGEILLKEPGKYVVLFDNSYSLMRTKVVFYNIAVF